MTYTIEQLREEAASYIARNGYDRFMLKTVAAFIDFLSEPKAAYDYPLGYSDDDDYQTYLIPGSKPELTTNMDENYGC